MLKNGNKTVKRLDYEQALKASTTHAHDFVTPYVAGLADIIDLDVIRSAGLRLGVDPLGEPMWAIGNPLPLNTI
ncbi:hypothetical protein NON20_22935 [Synechocystis sp. B12]|nr:hypothetical protein NON20_22935 [Synechocystis sp. B12]